MATYNTFLQLDSKHEKVIKYLQPVFIVKN